MISVVAPGLWSDRRGPGIRSGRRGTGGRDWARPPVAGRGGRPTGTRPGPVP